MHPLPEIEMLQNMGRAVGARGAGGATAPPVFRGIYPSRPKKRGFQGKIQGFAPPVFQNLSCRPLCFSEPPTGLRNIAIHTAYSYVFSEDFDLKCTLPSNHMFPSNHSEFNDHKRSKLSVSFSDMPMSNLSIPSDL